MNKNIPDVTIKKLSATEYDLSCPKRKRDYHLRKENDAWLISEFDSTIKNHDKAHIDTTELTKMEDFAFPDWAMVFEFIGAL